MGLVLDEGSEITTASRADSRKSADAAGKDLTRTADDGESVRGVEETEVDEESVIDSGDLRGDDDDDDDDGARSCLAWMPIASIILGTQIVVCAH